MNISSSARPRIVFAAAALMLAVGLIAGGTCAQSVFVQRLQAVYDGTPMDQATVRIGNWGSGICEESSQNAYSGSRSLKITPKDLYTGGRIDFVAPLDVTASMKNPSAYLQIICLFTGAQAQDQLTAALGTAAAPTDMYGGDTSNPGRPVRTLRTVLYFENGPAVEAQGPLSAYKVGADGWMVVSFPLSVIKGKTNLAQYKLTRMVITGDGTQPFNVGEIRTIPDESTLSADSSEDMEVSTNYPIAFQGFCTSGASAVKYSWDFDSRNGIQEQATGDLVYHRFTQVGDFDVTLTVSDLFGVKQPATKVIHVKVNE